MVKITFPNRMTKERAIEIVEAEYGAMYWQPEKGKTSAYPLYSNNPVVIEHASQHVVSPDAEIDADKRICNKCGRKKDVTGICIPCSRR